MDASQIKEDFHESHTQNIVNKLDSDYFKRNTFDKKSIKTSYIPTGLEPSLTKKDQSDSSKNYHRKKSPFDKEVDISSNSIFNHMFPTSSQRNLKQRTSSFDNISSSSSRKKLDQSSRHQLSYHIDSASKLENLSLDIHKPNHSLTFLLKEIDSPENSITDIHSNKGIRSVDKQKRNSVCKKNINL